MSTLLDKGRELIYVYPEVRTYSDRGDLKKSPAKEPVALRCTTSRDRSQIASIPGQVDVHILRATTRKLPRALRDDASPEGPGSTWMRIVYMGAEYDLNEPPRYAPGPSRATSHWWFTLRSRNNMAQISTPGIRQSTLNGPDAFGPVGGGSYG